VTLLIPVAALVLVLATDLWVYADATSQAGRGTPVVLSIGGFTLETPVVWFIACLILWVIFFPLYVVGRTNSSDRSAV
jgi:hypothetical protein